MQEILFILLYMLSLFTKNILPSAVLAHKITEGFYLILILFVEYLSNPSIYVMDIKRVTYYWNKTNVEETKLR